MYRALVGKPEGRRPLKRPRRRWVDNIRMDLQEVGCGYNNNNYYYNIYLTAIGLSPGGSGFKHIYKYLTLCY